MSHFTCAYDIEYFRQGYLTRGLAAIYFNDARLEVIHVTPPTSRRSRCGGQAAVPTAAAGEAVVAT